MMGSKELKILMIGNSFSICVGKYLPHIVKSVPGCRLLLGSCYIGGCPLEEHWENIEKAAKDPEYKPYLVNIWDSESRKILREDGNVNAALCREKWDIVTIQQASHQSWDYNCYQPYGDKLISYIRKVAPQAEIIVQQTWSYRADSPRLTEWGFDNNTMYEKLKIAYAEFAARYNFRLIPTGDAVMTFRRNSPVKFQPFTREELESCSWPDLPRQAGDVVGRTRWIKDSSGEMVPYTDFIHLNSAGEYMQSCLWFSFIFGESVDRIKYIPPVLGKKEAAFLRECVKETLKQ